MRGEGWTLAAGGGGGGDGGGQERGRGGARGKQEEKASVRTLGHATEFGWLFTPTEARRRSLIDTAWLRDFSRDIEALQEEIRRQACVYSEKTSNREDPVGRDRLSEIERQAACMYSEKTNCHEEIRPREAKSQVVCVYNENTSSYENAAGRDRYSKIERQAACVLREKTINQEEIRHREAKRQVASVRNKEISYPENAAVRSKHSEIERQAACVHSKETSIHEDAALRDSHSEVERLQCELRRSFVCRGGARTRHNEKDVLRTECHSAECCRVAMKGSDQSECCSSPDEAQCGERLAVVPTMIANCRELAVSSTPQTAALDSNEVGVCNGVTAGRESNRGGSDWGPKVKEGSESHCPSVGEFSASEMSCNLDSGLSTFGDDAATCGMVYSRVKHGAQTQVSTGDDSCAGEESFLLDTSLGTYTSVATKCDAYSSMHSDVSRDSGIFTADDTSFLSDAPGDLSLLEELGDALSDEDVSLEPCIQYGSLPLEDIKPGTRRYSKDAGYSVWLARFSDSNDLSPRSWGSYEWEVREDAEHGSRSYVTGSVSPAVRRRAKCSSPEKNDSNAVFSGEETEEQAGKGKRCSSCEKTNERVKVTQCRECKNLNNEGVSVKLCAACQNPNEVNETQQQRCESKNRNEGKGVNVAKCVACTKLQQESPISRQATQELAVVAKFRQSFQGINKRVEDLRAGLDSLVGEVNKSKHEFMSLEWRATQLLASTASSRHRLTRVRALQLLEDRLQEEWWAAYDPSSAPFHENYIV